MNELFKYLIIVKELCIKLDYPIRLTHMTRMEVIILKEAINKFDANIQCFCL